MIPADVWTNWMNIMADVAIMLMSNPLTSFVFGSLVVTIVANLIFRIGGKSNPAE